jgi:hypothetical protein
MVHSIVNWYEAIKERSEGLKRKSEPSPYVKNTNMLRRSSYIKVNLELSKSVSSRES